MADLKATHCGELPKNEFSLQTEQPISLLERRGLMEDHSIVNEKVRQVEKDLRRNMYYTEALPGHRLGLGVLSRAGGGGIGPPAERPGCPAQHGGYPVGYGEREIRAPDVEYQAFPIAAGPGQRGPDGAPSKTGEW